MLLALFKNGKPEPGQITIYNISVDSISTTGLMTLKLEKKLRYKDEKFYSALRAKGFAIKYF